MIRNVGNIDRVIRIVVSLALAYGAYTSSGAAAAILGVIAAAVFVTGLVGWCGLYTVLGVNTCKIDKP